MKKIIRYVLNKCGVDLVRFPHREDNSFVQLLFRLEIDTLFDIGANEGQFATSMRKYGYSNKIISFEPLDEAYLVLKKKAKNLNWIACHSAIGNEDGMIDINVSKNLVSSSILPITFESVNALPATAYYKKERVKIQRLDSVITNYVNDTSNIFVKIDTQGFEKKVIEGAFESLPRIKGFIMELSFVTLYEGETLFFDMISYMKSLGFSLWQITPGFTNIDTQRMLQADVVFVRE